MVGALLLALVSSVVVVALIISKAHVFKFVLTHLFHAEVAEVVPFTINVSVADCFVVMFFTEDAAKSTFVFIRGGLVLADVAEIIIRAVGSSVVDVPGAVHDTVNVFSVPLVPLTARIGFAFSGVTISRSAALFAALGLRRNHGSVVEAVLAEIVVDASIGGGVGLALTFAASIFRIPFATSPIAVTRGVEAVFRERISFLTADVAGGVEGVVGQVFGLPVALRVGSAGRFVGEDAAARLALSTKEFTKLFVSERITELDTVVLGNSPGAPVLLTFTSIVVPQASDITSA